MERPLIIFNEPVQVETFYKNLSYKNADAEILSESKNIKNLKLFIN